MRIESYERGTAIATAILVALVAVVIGWGIYALVTETTAQANGIRVGEVYARRLSPRHCQNMTVATNVAVPICTEESYSIYIESDGRTNHWPVTKDVYETAHMGDTFSYDCGCYTRRAVSTVQP